MTKISLVTGLISLSLMHSAMAMDQLDISSVGMNPSDFQKNVQEIQQGLEDGEYSYVNHHIESLLRQNLTPSQIEEMSILRVQAESGLSHQQNVNHEENFLKQMNTLRQLLNQGNPQAVLDHASLMHKDQLTEKQQEHLAVLMSEASNALSHQAKAHAPIDHHQQNFVESMQHLRQLLDQGNPQAVLVDAEYLMNDQLTDHQQEELAIIMSEASNALDAVARNARVQQHGGPGEWEAYNPEDLKDRDVVNKMKHNQGIREQFNPGAYNPNQEGYFNPNAGQAQIDAMDPELRAQLNRRLEKLEKQGE